MKFYLTSLSFLVAGFMFILSQNVYGYTAADYYNAGLQLYNAKNYPQAIQYFSAAISLDPNNAADLQGRANCHYALGEYQDALNDYEKVQAISPSDQLSQFIQSLRTKVGASGPAMAAPAAGGSFDQGVALYQQKQYAAAIPFFQKAVQENPNDAKAYYYLGVNQMMTGDQKDAALNLAISNQKQPNPSVEAYVNQLKARLSPEDQQWVDGQLAASSSASSTQVTAPVAFKKREGRLKAGIALFNLTDFMANAQTNHDEAAFLQTSDATVTFSAVVPTGSPYLGLESGFRLSPQFYVGVAMAFMPMGKATDDIHNSNSVTITDSFNITAVPIQLNARYSFGSGSIQPYVSAGFLIAPVNIQYDEAFNDPSLTNTATGDFSGIAFGGQVELGLDWNLGDSFAVGPFVGYQLASGNSFTTKMDITTNGVKQTGQPVQLEVVPTSNGNLITVISNGNIVVPYADGNKAINMGTPMPAGSRPLAVDIGGLTGGVQVSVFF
jgi:tetratricopeptide (TPR) repeat protein